MTILSCCGKQGSGKSTLADVVQDHYKGRGLEVRRIAFATPLYKIQDMAFKEMAEITQMSPPAKDGTFLQAIGTVGRERFSKDIWVIALKQFIFECSEQKVDLVIVDDCRFEHEFEFLRGLNSILVYLKCPEEIRKQRAKSWRPNTLHESEVGLDVYANMEGKFDYVLPTNILSEWACFMQFKWTLDNKLGIRNDKQR